VRSAYPYVSPVNLVKSTLDGTSVHAACWLASWQTSPASVWSRVTRDVGEDRFWQDRRKRSRCETRWRRPKDPSTLPDASCRTEPAGRIPPAPCTKHGYKDSEPYWTTWEPKRSPSPQRCVVFVVVPVAPGVDVLVALWLSVGQTLPDESRVLRPALLTSGLGGAIHRPHRPQRVPMRQNTCKIVDS
jgi:hypothetical protein